MKYLVYQSKEKLDMLKSQISESFLAGYDVKVTAKAGVEVSGGSLEDVHKFETSTNMIQLLDDRLEKQGEVDKIGRKPYVYAKAALKMCRYNRLSCVYWHGMYYPQKDVKCVVLLAGSLRHLLGGGYIGEKLEVSPSLSRFYEELFDEVLENYDYLMPKNRYRMSEKEHDFAESLKYLIRQDQSVTADNFEFTAKVFERKLFNKNSKLWSFFVSEDETQVEWLHVVYGSPLYVAMLPDESRSIELNGKKCVPIGKRRKKELMPGLPLSHIVRGINYRDYKQVCERLITSVTNDLYSAQLPERVAEFQEAVQKVLSVHEIAEWSLDSDLNLISEMVGEIYKIAEEIYVVREDWF